MMLFLVSYLLTVVTFQILPTPRYNLPLVPIIVLASSAIVSHYLHTIPTLLVLFLGALNFIGLFFSADPVSIILWDKSTIAGMTFYNISKYEIDDGLVYNLQYLRALKKRAQANLVNVQLCNLADN